MNDFFYTGVRLRLIRLELSSGRSLSFFAPLFACARVRVRNYMEVLVSAYDNGGRVRVRLLEWCRCPCPPMIMEDVSVSAYIYTTYRPDKYHTARCNRHRTMAIFICPRMHGTDNKIVLRLCVRACVRVSVRLWTLSRSHFFVDFHQIGHGRVNPQK